MTTELSMPEMALRMELEREVETAITHQFRGGIALKRLRDERLYRNDWNSWEEYVRDRFQISRTRAHQLIDASEIKLSPIGDKIENEGQARAIALVPEKDRPKVLAKAEKAGGITAASITEAAESLEKKKDRVIELDKTDCVIPENIIEDWHRAEATASDLLSKLSDVKCALEAGINDQDLIFRELHNTDIAAVKSFVTKIKGVRPYAVCPTCSGHQKAKCILCRGRGFMSEFLWKQCVPAEVKTIRQKASQCR